MVVASGFIEVTESGEVERVSGELRMRDIEVNEINNEKIVFIIERETMAEVKDDFEPLRDIKGVKNVHLAYYSIEGAD
ncbi:MAG: hypothetical protein C4526_12065 [Nitrospiraceae bacterium]|nr:MAG: hypothetical protein C4526_12065 [Nitrospiraceae bacterium]